jgi:glycosyltransferase involved in cell wall biosynthesis
MKVSVLMAAYNYGKFIGAAIESVLSQDYQGPVECVVVDDGSTDGTPAVVARFEKAVRSIRQANAGQAAAFNRAFTESTGEVICFLDADDLWRPSKVRRVVEAFAADSEVGLVHHGLEKHVENGAEAGDFEGSPRHPFDGNVSQVMLLRVLPWGFSPTSGLSLRRELCEVIFPLTTGLKTSADELIAPVAALLAPVRYIEEPLGVYRIHGSNLWSVTQRRHEEADRMYKAARYVSLTEEKVGHANGVLRRAGRSVRLSPFLRHRYIERYCQVHSVSPLSCLPAIRRGLLVENGWGWTQSVLWILRLVPLILKHYKKGLKHWFVSK